MSENTAAQQAAVQNPWELFRIAGLSVSLIDLLYFGMLCFFIYQTIKGRRLEAKLREPKYIYHAKSKTMNLVLTGIILVFGVLTFVLNQGIVTGVLMILLGIMFFFSSKTRIILSPEGIIADNSFVRWEDVRKWGWDVKGGSLIFVVKEKGKPSRQEVLRVGKVNYTEINERIRVLKLGKHSDYLLEKGAQGDLEAEVEGKEMELSQVSVPEKLDSAEGVPTAQQTETHRVGLKGTGKANRKKRK